MPEMPEVETIRRSLCGHVEGKKIRDVEIRLARLVKWPSAEDFRAILSGRRIESLERKAKYLLFHLDGGWVLVIHLRMTGRLFYRAVSCAEDFAARMVLKFESGDALEYSDARTLGTLYLMKEDEIQRIHGLASLGPEPLSDGFTAEYLGAVLARRKGKIKSILLDQSLIGGLGNIYVDESLARAGIRPERAACGLGSDEVGRLFSAINQVIAQGIDNGGTTLKDYRDGEGRSGTFQEVLAVYGRKGQPCPCCGTPVVRTEVGGRGTHYCPECQK